MNAARTAMATDMQVQREIFVFRRLVWGSQSLVLHQPSTFANNPFCTDSRVLYMVAVVSASRLLSPMQLQARPQLAALKPN